MAEHGRLSCRDEVLLAAVFGAGGGTCSYREAEDADLIVMWGSGKRAEPRNKPPFPAQSGLFGKPAAVNNVETLLSVLEILRVGGPAYAAIGTENSTGTRLFCLSGCAAGSFVGPDALDLPLMFEAVRAARMTLG
jgi:NADH:ubiquinone oxidoreductase subunit F (NADH-binding)